MGLHATDVPALARVMRRAVARRQHRHGRRARAGGRARVRPRHRDGPGRRTARRPHPLRRHARGAREEHGSAHRAGLGRASHGPAPSGASRQRVARSSAARGSTTCEASTSASRSGSSARSRGRAAPASPRWRTTSSIARPRARSGRPAASTSPAPTTRSMAARRARARRARRPVAARPHGAWQRRDLRRRRGTACARASPPSRRRAGAGSPRPTSRSTSRQGRCEECAGEGYETVEMQFLADVQLLCPVCQGKRFKPEVLAVTAPRASPIADVLAMTSTRRSSLLRSGPDDRDYVLAPRARSARRKVGLGYLSLGQPLSTLSGGEAQRLKLARALSEETEGHALRRRRAERGPPRRRTPRYVVAALHELVDAGASVVVVEHDLDVIRACDWVIDLGPGGGPHGGRSSPKARPRMSRERDADRAGAARPARGAASRTGATARRRSTSGEGAVRSPPDHRRVARARAQPQGRLVRDPARQAVRRHRPERLGQVVARLRRRLRRGPAPFIETLTPYARQFLPTLPTARRRRGDRGSSVDRPRAAHVAGRAPTRRSRPSPRSRTTSACSTPRSASCTARNATRHVAPSSAPTRSSSGSRGVEGKRTVYAPAVRARKGTYLDVFTTPRARASRAARVDGAIVAIEPPPKLAKAKEHTIDLIVHYGKLGTLDRAAFDRALVWGGGALRVARGTPTAAQGRGEERILSTARACTNVRHRHPRARSALVLVQHEAGPLRSVRGHRASRAEKKTSRTRASRTRHARACKGVRLSADARGACASTAQTYAADDDPASLAAPRVAPST